MKSILSILTFLFVFNAKAAFFVEPYLGFLYGSFDDATNDTSVRGFGLGARGGYELMSLMGGLELQVGAVSADTSPTETDFEQNDIGVFGGFIFPGMPLEAWMSYYFYSRADGSPGGDYSGQSVKFGAGADPLPNISFNIEYKLSSYDKLKIGGTEQVVDADINTLLFSVSFFFIGP